MIMFGPLLNREEPGISCARFIHVGVRGGVQARGAISVSPVSYSLCASNFTIMLVEVFSWCNVNNFTASASTNLLAH